MVKKNSARDAAKQQFRLAPCSHGGADCLEVGHFLGDAAMRCRIGVLQKRVVSRLVVEFFRGTDPSPSADLPRLCELISVVSKLKIADEEFANELNGVEACFSFFTNPKPRAVQLNCGGEREATAGKTWVFLQGFSE